VAQAGSGIQDELVRRHRATIRVVNGAFGLASLLAAVAAFRRVVAGGRMTAGHLLNELLGQVAPDTAPDPVLQISLWLGVAFLAFGAIYYRRTKFAPVRLKAVAGLRGAAGLIETLQKTTVRVALIGVVVAVLGFVSSLLTGLFGDMLRAWLIALAVLAYAYPRRGAWQRVVAAADGADVNTEPAAKGTFA
jgi:hypothetical protein